MPKFEQFGQGNTEKTGNPEDKAESREQFGDRALQAAQEVYADEIKTLETKSAVFEKLGDIGYTVAVPGSLYIIGKFFGVDIEKMTSLNISESTDSLIRLSWAISMLGASSAFFAQMHFEKKLNYLKEKFGILSKSENQETE